MAILRLLLSRIRQRKTTPPVVRLLLHAAWFLQIARGRLLQEPPPLLSCSCQLATNQQQSACWPVIRERTHPHVMVDIESDGPIPGDYSMIWFGADIVEPELNRTFYGKLRPVSNAFIPEALAVSGFSREECLDFDNPKAVIELKISFA